MGVSVEGLKCEAAIIKIGDRTWKITKIALNNLGAWLQTHVHGQICVTEPVRTEQNREGCCPWDLVTDFSFWWAVGWVQCSGQVRRSRGLPGRGSEFSLLDAVLQVSQWARGAISYVSEQSNSKAPSLSKGGGEHGFYSLHHWQWSNCILNLERQQKQK
jgi:hypothetical protein